MADSPRYQRANLVYADMPNIQPVDLQEQLNANKRIGAALDTMTNITSDIGKKYAIESAAKYSLDNPVTQEQLIDAQKNNSNPIAKDLKGGTIFNETLKKVYAQQASAEFTNIAYTHFEDVDKRVKDGELTNPDDIKQALNSVIEPQKNVLGQIDVETGLAYDAKLKSYANTYYKSALNELDKQARTRIDLMATDTMNSLTKMFEKDLVNQYDPIVIKGLLDAKLQDGDLTFKQGSHQQAYNNQLRKQLEYAINNKFAEDMASSFGSEGAAMQALAKGKAGKWTAFWADKTPDQKDDLRDFVLKELRIKNAGAEEFDRQYASKLSAANDMLTNGVQPDAGLSQWLINNSGSLKADSATKASATAFNMKLDQFNKLNGMSMADRQVYEDSMLAKIGPNMTAENWQVFSFIKKSNENFNANIKKDFVATMKTQNAFRATSLNFAAPDSEFQDQADNRVKLANQFGTMNGIKPKYLDEGEIQTLQMQLDAAKPDEKVAMLGRIAKSFGGSSSEVFKQLSPKDPVSAHMGVLYANKSNDIIIRNAAKGQEILKSGYKPVEEPTQKQLAIKDSIGSSLYSAPESYNDVVKTADALYAEYAMRNNLSAFNGTVYGEKLQEAAGRTSGADGKYYGGVVKYNKEKVIIPNSVPQDDFEDLMDKATIADLRYSSDNFANRANTNGLFAQNGKEYTSDKIKDAKLVPAGKDNYMLTIDDSPFILKGGSPLYINIDVLYKKLKSEKRI
jgi:hypothetical protein